MDYLCKGLQGLPARRKAAGFTQEEFAEALGVTRSALAAWETGRAWPSAAILPQIADLLLCSIDELYKAPAPTDYWMIFDSWAPGGYWATCETCERKDCRHAGKYFIACEHHTKNTNKGD